MPEQAMSSEPMRRAADLSLAALRVAASAVLVWGALAKLTGGDRIGELAATWAEAGVPLPELLVPILIVLQLVLALFLLVGLFARAAGLLIAATFAAAAAASGILAGSNWWAFALLIVLLLHFGMLGAGRLSLDGLRGRRLAASGAGHRSLDELMASLGIEPQQDSGNYPGRGRD